MSEHYPTARFNDGDKVTHAVEGPGVVINHTDDYVQVRFDDDHEEAFPQTDRDLEPQK